MYGAHDPRKDACRKADHDGKVTADTEDVGGVMTDMLNGEEANEGREGEHHASMAQGMEKSKKKIERMV